MAVTRVAGALLSLVAVAVGVGLIYLPAGVIVLGLEGLGAVYVATYLEVRRATPRRAGPHDTSGK